MSYDKFLNMLFVSLVSVCVVAVVILVINYTQPALFTKCDDPYIIPCESCNMRFDTENMKGLQGVYSHPQYFCVWTQNRTPEEIAETTMHELSHFYVNTYPEHFIK